MSTDKTLLVNKLILIVLVLILGCLIILVVQQGSRPRNLPESPSDIASQTEETSARLRTEPVSYLPVTNRAIIKPKLGSNTRPSPNRTSDRSVTEASEP